MTIRTVTLVDFYDILECAQELGYHWNDANNFLGKDIYPMPGEGTADHDLNQMKFNTEWSEATKKVMGAFYAKHGLTSFTLTMD